MTARGELAATLAHEINQPLGAIVSDAEAASGTSHFQGSLHDGRAKGMGTSWSTMPGPPPPAGAINSRATNRGQIMCYLQATPFALPSRSADGTFRPAVGGTPWYGTAG